LDEATVEALHAWCVEHLDLGRPCGGVCVYRPGAAGIQGAAYSEPGAARRQASRRRCQLGVPTTSLPWDNAKR